MTWPTLPTLDPSDVWGGTINQALNDLHTRAGNLGVINVKDYGATANGVTDDGPAILAAVQAAWDTNASLGTGYTPTVYVPAGTYKIGTTIDFSTLNLHGTSLNGWQFLCDPSAYFLDGTASGPVIKIQPPGGGSYQFFECRFVLGEVIGKGKGVGSNNGVQFVGLYNCTLDMGAVRFMGASGVVVDIHASMGTFNGLVRINRITDCGANGFMTYGAATAYGFQANTVWIGEITGNTSNGVVLDATGNQNTVYNRFFLGDVSDSGGAGIYDRVGGNEFNVLYTGNNVSGGYNLDNADNRPPIVRGYFTDFTILNGHVADLVNWWIAMGNVTAPAVPASTVLQANTFGRPARVYVNGGTVSAIAVSGKVAATTVATGATSGSFWLQPGQTIKLTYTVAPTWTWFLE